ncbi:hypothetical protein [Conexibacter sp. DBS9H8]|uniref:hypothetical protein n=1 Tax=Conexibacter sp. DBS9H8 TaxID=2937801 RepID=UPI00200C8407|nr:hypothetical protein [Conexibacter sp. DBS9H8]
MTASRLLTAPLAAAGLIAGFGVAVASGSRPLGGLVMAAFGLTCIVLWLQRDGRRTAGLLTGIGLLAFALSHVLGLVIGAWPSVFVVSAATAYACWRLSDAGWVGRRAARPRAGLAA